MAYREYPPHPSLRKHVACYWTRSPDLNGTARRHQVLPDGCIDILFRVSPKGATAQGRVIGTMKTPIWVPSSSTEFVAVRFLPGGAVPFLRVPAWELTDSSFSLDHFWGDRVLKIQEHLQCLEAEARVRLLEAELLKRLGVAEAPDQTIAYLVKQIAEWPELPDVVGLAGAVGVSCRQLERKFLNTVGVGPKTFLRVVRLQRAVTQMKHGTIQSWADFAMEAGYYDQAHLIRDFKLLTLHTPKKYLQTVLA